MILVLTKIILILIIQITVSNANVILGPFSAKPKFRFGVVIEPHLQKSTENILESAMALVITILREKIDIQREFNGKYDFIIEVTDRKTVETKNKENAEIQSFNRDLNGDAYSFMFLDSPGAPIVVRVLWDEAMTEIKDGKRIERSDAFVRLVTLLGHEIYGNVMNFFIRRDLFESPQYKFSKKKQKEEWLKSEVLAFKAGVDFITMMMDKLALHLSEKMKLDFQGAIKREKESLKYFESRLNAFLGDSNNVVSFKKSIRCKSFY